MQSTSENAGLDESQAGIKIAGRNINNLDRQMTPPYGRKWRRTEDEVLSSRTVLMKVKEESENVGLKGVPLCNGEHSGLWKCWLKAQHSEN